MPQQKNKKIFIYFFIFLVIGTLNNKNLSNNNFAKVNTISVTGLDEINNLDLHNKLDLLKVKNLFFLNKTEIKKILDSNSLVEQYSVFKKYPATLNVTVDKTKFIAKVKRNSDIFFLGSNGKLIKTDNIKKDVPFIFGNFNKKDFFELKKVIDETNFDYLEIKNLFFFKSGRWDIETKNGLLIKLPKNDLKKKLKLLIKFLSKNDQKKINKIDLRQNNQIIINGK